MRTTAGGPAHSAGPPRRADARRVASVAAILTFSAVGAVACAPEQAPTVSASARPSSAPTPQPTSTTPPALSDEDIAALPPVTYDAVIPALLPYADTTRSSATVYTLRADAPLYGADRSQAVARFPAINFLGEPSPVVVVAQRDEWAFVLTPSRRELPSQRPSTATQPAAAQTAAWVPLALLENGQPVTKRIIVDVSDETLSIVEHDNVISTFPIGVGASDTPTPTGVTGYLQARYLDAAQGQAEHRIQLTSLHATAADEPYGGNDGGLIGAHFQTTARGAVSHGCLRLDADALTSIDTLPLGTLVTIVA